MACVVHNLDDFFAVVGSHAGKAVCGPRVEEPRQIVLPAHQDMCVPSQLERVGKTCRRNRHSAFAHIVNVITGQPIFLTRNDARGSPVFGSDRQASLLHKVE